MNKSIHDGRYRKLILYLKRSRTDLGLTQSDVAGKLGWHRTKLSNIEILERRIDILELHELASLYGMRLSDLESLLDGKGNGGGAEDP